MRNGIGGPRDTGNIEISLDAVVGLSPLVARITPLSHSLNGFGSIGELRFVELKFVLQNKVDLQTGAAVPLCIEDPGISFAQSQPSGPVVAKFASEWIHQRTAIFGPKFLVSKHEY